MPNGGNGHPENPYWPLLQASDVQDLTDALRATAVCVRSLNETIQRFLQVNRDGNTDRIAAVGAIMARLDQLEAAIKAKGS